MYLVFSTLFKHSHHVYICWHRQCVLNFPQYSLREGESTRHSKQTVMSNVFSQTVRNLLHNQNHTLNGRERKHPCHGHRDWSEFNQPPRRRQPRQIRDLTGDTSYGWNSFRRRLVRSILSNCLPVFESSVLFLQQNVCYFFFVKPSKYVATYTIFIGSEINAIHVI